MLTGENKKKFDEWFNLQPYTYKKIYSVGREDIDVDDVFIFWI